MFIDFVVLVGTYFLIIMSKDIGKKCKIDNIKTRLKTSMKYEDGRKIDWTMNYIYKTIKCNQFFTSVLEFHPAHLREVCQEGTVLRKNSGTKQEEKIWKRSQGGHAHREIWSEHVKQRHLAAVVEIHRHLGPSLPNAFQLRFLENSKTKQKGLCKGERNRKDSKEKKNAKVRVAGNSWDSDYLSLLHTLVYDVINSVPRASLSVLIGFNILTFGPQTRDALGMRARNDEVPALASVGSWILGPAAEEHVKKNKQMHFRSLKLLKPKSIHHVSIFLRDFKQHETYMTLSYIIHIHDP